MGDSSEPEDGPSTSFSPCTISTRYVKDSYTQFQSAKEVVSYDGLCIITLQYTCDITYAHILDNFNYDFNFNSKCLHL